MDLKKKHTGGINIGTSSILVTFVLLALVTFAALSYLSAKSDYTLSKEAADRTASFYDANRMAEIYLANIEGLLAKHNEKSQNADEYYDGIEKLFADNDRITVEGEGENTTLSYSVAVTNGQNLEVVLLANYPEKDEDKLFYIEKWATQINGEWFDEIVEEGSKKSGVKLLF